MAKKQSSAKKTVPSEATTKAGWSPPTGEILDRATKLIKTLLSEGEKPKTPEGSSMWDPRALAKWYASCRALSALLGMDNPWQSLLCSWNFEIGDNRNFHITMLGTLEAISEYLSGNS